MGGRASCDAHERARALAAGEGQAAALRARRKVRVEAVAVAALGGELYEVPVVDHARCLVCGALVVGHNPLQVSVDCASTLGFEPMSVKTEKGRSSPALRGRRVAQKPSRCAEGGRFLPAAPRRVRRTPAPR